MTGPGGRIYQSDSRRLADLMSVDAGAERIWRPEELKAILQHQLSVPIQFDLSGIDPGLARTMGTLAAAQGLLVKSFNDLLHHPSPPLELLQLTKQFAKSSRSHPDSPLPPEIATVLYFASIAVAMTRCDERITNLDDETLRRGIEWVLAQPWVDDATRGLFQESLERFDQLGGQSE